MLHWRMWLILLCLWALIPPSLGNVATNPRTGLSDVFQLKCDSLPYRTVFFESKCYFIIDVYLDKAETSMSCTRALSGSHLATDVPDAVLSTVFGEKGDFLLAGSNSTEKKKKAMCIYDNELRSRVTKSRIIFVNEKPKLNYHLPLPFRQKLDPIEIGQTFIFKGTVPPTSADWCINFHSVAPVMSIYDMPLHISFRFDMGQIRFLYFKRGMVEYSGDEGRNRPMSLVKNEKFEIRIVALEDNWKIFINDKEFECPYLLPQRLNNISHVSVYPRYGDSDVQLHYVHVGEKYSPVPSESGIIRGFSYCKSLFISGKIEAGITQASVNFIRANTSIFEQNALHFSTRFNYGNVLLNDVKNGQWGSEQIERDMLFFQELPFNLTITNERHGFVVYVDGEYYTTFKHRICPMDITSLRIVNIVDMKLTVSHVANCQIANTEQQTCPGAAKPATVAKTEPPKLGYLLPLPFKQKLDPIKIGQIFTFKGFIPPNPVDWCINFHSVAPTLNANDIPLHISFRFDMGQVRFLIYKGGWGNDEGRQKPMPIGKNKKFEIRIVALEDRWKIFINNKEWTDCPYLMPLNLISHVMVWARYGYNDVQLHYVHLGQKYNPVPLEKGIIPDFSFCKSIFISAKIEWGVPRVSVNFIRKNSALDKENALHFNPRLDLGNVLLIDVKNGQGGAQQIEEMIFFQEFPFNLTITNECDGFVVFVDNEYYTTFKHRISPTDITDISLLSFADMNVTVSTVDNCRVTEDNKCPAVTRKTKRELPKLGALLPLPYKQKLDPIEIGQVFTFRGIIPPNSVDWCINFHSVAPTLDQNDLPLHMSFRFDMGQVRFLYYKGGYSGDEGRNKPMPMLKNKQFEVRIVALEDRWQVFINNKYWTDCPHLMPMFRISHLSVFARFGLSDVQLHYVNVGDKQE